MKIFKPIGKITKLHAKGGSINHLIHHGGNISELKKQLSHLLIKSKPKKRIKF